MTMNDDSQARDAAGKFAAVEGSQPEVDLALRAPSADNSFLDPGKECYCDNEGRCDNHDWDAAESYWSGVYQSNRGWKPLSPGPDPALAYEKNDPKHPDYADRLGL